ncbi:hypothetical protein DFJ73DRAFT_785104 [Zopfochytrium polystomum]|nr:hypothetical protein DFJ73DRAFT_785104 [Zopfochytrium polystomum]
MLFTFTSSFAAAAAALALSLMSSPTPAAATPAPVWMWVAEDAAPAGGFNSDANRAAAAAAAPAAPYCNMPDRGAPIVVPVDESGKPLVKTYADAQSYCKAYFYALSPNDSGFNEVLGRLMDKCGVGKAWIGSYEKEKFTYPLFIMPKSYPDPEYGYGIYANIKGDDRLPFICTTSANFA